MAERVFARRTSVDVMFDGTDITKDIEPYLLDLIYTDDTDDLADDLKIGVQDRDGVWLETWLAEAVEAAAGGRLSISAVIKPEHWKKDETLKTGAFELDSVDASGPPATVTISASSLAFSSDLRQTRKSKAWKNYNLSGIASEIAAGGGMGCMYEASANPSYDRVEQTRQSDIAFLRKLCQDAGISIKATDGKLVLYDQAEYEAKAAVRTIEKGAKGGYIKYKLHSGSADTQYAKCRVRYMDPNTGKCIEGTAEDSGVSGDQCLEVKAKVGNVGEAQALAKKRLRLHNKLAKTATFTMPGDVGLVAGVTVQLKGWGGWDGKYIVTRAVHTVGGGGYTTQISIRKVLDY
ncbi:MAG: hypothetical protein HFF31_11400 [Flavonifractor sp.]|jgi:phage protein D|nr:hypothetical protein [Flavonifractor sp.]